MTNSIGFVFHNEIVVEAFDQQKNKKGYQDPLGIVAPCHRSADECFETRLGAHIWRFIKGPNARKG